MAAIGFEVTGSRTFTLDRAERRYRVEEAADEDEVVAWINANAPSTIIDLPMSEFNCQEIDEEDGTYDVVVTWGTSKNEVQQTIATSDYKFSYQAPGGQIYQSLATIAAYSATADDPRDFGGAINVVNDDGKDRVEGMNLSPPNETFSLAYSDVSSVIDGTYQSVVESLVGKVNSTTFRGRSAGTVMLVRVNGGRSSSGIWSIDFGFGYVANATSIPVGDDITVTSKDGHDLLWPYYGKVKDDDAKATVKRPISAYVERIYARADLTALNLPS